MIARPSWARTWMDVAEVVSRRATCPRASCGAVLVNPEQQLIATGYNGAPRRGDHCIDVGCYLVNGSCKRAVHAEMNAIYQAARNGISLAGSILICTHRPCIQCMPGIIQVGIKRIVYRDPYDTDESLPFVVASAQKNNIMLQQMREDD